MLRIHRYGKFSVFKTNKTHRFYIRLKTGLIISCSKTMTILSTAVNISKQIQYRIDTMCNEYSG